MALIHNKRYLKDIRKELRNHPTGAERWLWVKLKNSQLGYKFRRQHSIGSFVADFYCPKLNLVVEVDGETHNDQDVLKNDEAKEKFFQAKGLTVKRVSDSDITEDPEA
ncbi:MAG: endonuclease domain-containing protein, partial [Patescibacteria group bacterium]